MPRRPSLLSCALIVPLVLAAFLRADAGVGAGGVDEGQQRQLEAFGQLHQPQRLAVTLRARHAEVAAHLGLGVAALLVADDHHRAAVDAAHKFIDLAAACRLFVTNDSGAMHIASALGVPAVTVFGATDDTTTGPTGPRARVVREPVECSPCLLRECPIDHRCMTRVTAERVIAVAREVSDN